MAAHLQKLNLVRSDAVIRQQMYFGLLEALNSSMVSFSIGIMLLLAGQAIAAGTFTVGDFALFVSYLWFTTHVPSELGIFYGDYKTQEVSIDRMLELIEPEPVEALVELHPVYIRGSIPLPPFISKEESDRLEILEVRGLTYRHGGEVNGEAFEPNGETGAKESLPRGIEDISFSLRRGDFVVVTGKVGSGKSTLVRLLTGMLPREFRRDSVEWQNYPEPGRLLPPAALCHHLASAAPVQRHLAQQYPPGVARGAG